MIIIIIFIFYIFLRLLWYANWEIGVTLMMCRLQAMTLFARSLYAWSSLWQAYLT